MRKSLCAVVACVSSLATTANAAEIAFKQTTQPPYIEILGDIEAGDFFRFEQIAESVPSNTTVLLNSNGGALEAGIKIGRKIHKLGFSTGVLTICASACALAWLGGRQRFAAADSRIGFHAAYVGDLTRKESGSGNALVGLYLGELGFNENVVKYMTSAPPDGMEWLSARDAVLLGVDVTVVTSGPPAAGSVPVATTPAEIPPPPAAQTLAMNFVSSLVADHNGSGERALASVLSNYGQDVNYYGKTIPLSAVYKDKMLYFLRWPVRKSTINGSTIMARCQGTVCDVTGLYEWLVSNPEKKKLISGTASFYYQLDIGTTIRVLAEGGTVLSKNP